MGTLFSKCAWACVVVGVNGIETTYIETPPHPRYTFELASIREWVEDNLLGEVLNACCGKSKIKHTNQIKRNDINTEIDADTHLDVCELPREYGQNSFDTILFDPPWTMYQANLRYDGENVTKEEISIDVSKLPQRVGREKQQVGHARLAKDGFDYMLRPGGKVIQLSYSGGCMPARLAYEKEQRVMFDPVGEGKTLIGSVDRKTQTKLL